MVIFFLALLSGALVKIVDWLEDDRKSRHISKYGFAILYGAIIGYLIANASFSTLFLAALIAQILSKKIDTLSHRIGFLSAVLIAFFYQLPEIDILFFGYFLLMAFLDEIDYVGKLRFLNEYRPFLKIAGIPFIFIGRFDYLFGILLFDLGYEIVKTISNKNKF